MNWISLSFCIVYKIEIMDPYITSVRIEIRQHTSHLHLARCKATALFKVKSCQVGFVSLPILMPNKGFTRMYNTPIFSGLKSKHKRHIQKVLFQCHKKNLGKFWELRWEQQLSAVYQMLHYNNLQQWPHYQCTKWTIMGVICMEDDSECKMTLHLETCLEKKGFLINFTTLL